MTTFLSIAWVAKFLIIPIIGWGVASLFFPASRRATPSSTNHVGESGSSPSEKRTERAQIRTPDGDMCYCSRTDDPFEAPRIIRVQAGTAWNPILFSSAPASARNSSAPASETRNPPPPSGSSDFFHPFSESSPYPTVEGNCEN